MTASGLPSGGTSSGPSLPAPVAAPRGTPRGSVGRLYGVFLRHQLTTGRIALMVVLAGVAVLLGFAIGVASDRPLRDATEFMNGYGFTIVVPLCSLVFASSTLGDTIDDRTLVYLWMTPVARSRMALAAALAALTVTLPLVTIPLTIAAALTGVGSELIISTALAAVVGTVAYVGIFGALGLRFRRALVWGIAYILIWEGFVATASETAAKLSLRAYTASILSQYTGVGLRLGTLTLGSSLLVPPLVALAFTALTARLLARTDVD